MIKGHKRNERVYKMAKDGYSLSRSLKYEEVRKFF